MTFEHPGFLWLLPLALVGAARALMFVCAGALRSGRGLVLALCVLLMIGAGVLAAAGPIWGEDAPPGDAGVVVVDVSASRTDGELAEAQKLYERVRSHPNLVGALVYGGSPERLERRRQWEARDAAEGTNTERALLAARALLVDVPAERRHVWLMTDGMDTHGDTPLAVQSLADAGIRLSVSETPRRADIAVQDIQHAPVVRRRQTFDLTVRVSSDTSSRVNVIVETLDGEPIGKRAVDLAPGEQGVRFSWEPRVEGVVDVVARVEALDGELSSQVDARPENDTRRSTLEVIAPPRTLLVSPDGRAATTLLTQGIKPERMQSEQLAGAAELLAPYELIVLDRVTAEELGLTRIHALGQWVREGGALVAFPGPNGLAKGSSEEAKAMRRWLPLATIDDEKVEPPPLALVFILDRSDSMGRERKWEVAARTTASAHAELNPKSTAGLLTFSDFPDWVVKPARVEETTDFAERVAGIRLRGGTDMFPALKAAYQELAPLDARLKHIVLLSDGVSLSRLKHNEALLHQIAAANITVSTVAMGTEADTETMSAIARITGGRYWFVANPDELPRIFAEETRRSAKDEREVTPLDAFRFKPLASLQLLNPERTQFSPTTRARARASSETLWEVDVVDEIAEGQERRPLLARHRYGRGRVIALASPLQASSLPPSLLMQGLVHSVVKVAPGQQLPIQIEARRGPDGTTLDVIRAEPGMLPPGYRLERLGAGDPETLALEPVAPDRARAYLPHRSEPTFVRIRDPRGVAVGWRPIVDESMLELRPRASGSGVSALLRMGATPVAAGEVPSWLGKTPETHRRIPLRVPLGLLALGLAALSIWVRRPPVGAT